MLTFRSSLILAVSTWLFVVSIMLRYEPLALVCLSVIFWIWLEWIWFQRRVFPSSESWSGVTRVVDNQSEDRITVVTGQTFKICLGGTLPDWTHGYRILIRDSIPDTIEFLEGAPAVTVDSLRSRRLAMQSLVRTPIGGRFSIPGFRVEISDFCGLFRKEHFIRREQTLVVLPFLIRPQTTVSVLKTNNLQRHLGHHRHRSSGLSSELHGIRDYRVGDPPRTIAWKPTARLGKPMTCEFESEVPIRATLLMDLSSYMFEGRPGLSPADRAMAASASVAKLLLADRDPVATTIVTDSGIRRLNHGSGERQLTLLLHQLLLCSNPNPPVEQLTIDELVQVVFENGARRFPELFDEQFNFGPIKRTLQFWRIAGHPRSRRALAVVLEQVLGLSHGFSTRLQYDDDAMRVMCVRYIERYSVFSDAVSAPLAARRPDLRRRVVATQAMCQQLTESRMRARDNELFVLIAAEPGDAVGIEMLLDAVRATVAARHRVIVVSPASARRPNQVRDPVAARILEMTEREDDRNRSSVLRDGLVSLGARFSRVDDPALMQLVAMEIGLLQSGSSRGKMIGAR